MATNCSAWSSSEPAWRRPPSSNIHEGNLEAAHRLLEDRFETWQHFKDLNYLLAYVYYKQGNKPDALGVLVDIPQDRLENLYLTPVIPARTYPMPDLEPPVQMPTPPSSDVPSGWRLVFSDGFIGSELGQSWKVQHGDWRVGGGMISASGGTAFKILELAGDYTDAQIEFQLRCKSGATWAGAYLRAAGGDISDARRYLRLLCWGRPELFNIHQANRIAITGVPTVSPGDWWWVRVRVQGQQAAAWLSADGKEFLCVDWGELMEKVPGKGRILLAVREGLAEASFRNVRVFAPQK